MKIAIISGGFDPVHKGHLELIDNIIESLNPQKIICIVNKDEFLLNKKGYKFQDLNQRLFIMNHIKGIDRAISAIDKDQTVCETLLSLRKEFPNDDLYFCNGGDRINSNTPELIVCEKLNINTVFNLGNKIESSSELVKRIKL